MNVHTRTVQNAAAGIGPYHSNQLAAFTGKIFRLILYPNFSLASCILLPSRSGIWAVLPASHCAETFSLRTCWWQTAVPSGEAPQDGASSYPPLAGGSGKPRRWPWQGHLWLLLVGTDQKGGEGRINACPEAFEMLSPWTRPSIPHSIILLFQRDRACSAGGTNRF